MVRHLLFVSILYVLANIPYKRKTFIDKPPYISVLISIWFVICSSTLMIPVVIRGFPSVPAWTLAPFLFVTVFWFLLQQPENEQITPKQVLAAPISATLHRKHVALVKFTEVMFQQASFLYLVTMVFGNVKDIRSLLSFTAFIAMVHMANLFFMKAAYALTYVLLSIPMAYLFGQWVANGLIFLTASIHLLYYLIEYRIVHYIGLSKVIKVR